MFAFYQRVPHIFSRASGGFVVTDTEEGVASLPMRVTTGFDVTIQSYINFGYITSS
jgi:hypothetical protein